MSAPMLRRLGSPWLAWALLGAWMGVIFYWSHQVKPGVPGAEIDLLRKSMHVAEYAVLYWLWWRALEAWGVRGGERLAGAALLGTFAYSVSDEIHQWLVGRDGSIRDILIDIALPLAIWIILTVQRRRVLPVPRRRSEDSGSRR